MEDEQQVCGNDETLNEYQIVFPQGNTMPH